MFKVSFKDDFMKVQTFNDKATVVTLKGTVMMPAWSEHIPQEIFNWIWTHPSVEAHDTWIAGNLKMFIEASGKAKCTKGDSFDSELGKRIAESRAKIKIYKFMHNLCESLMKYYYGIMYGNAEFDVIRESHTEAPKDCLYLTCKKYRELWIKESNHLGQLLKEA